MGGRRVWLQGTEGGWVGGGSGCRGLRVGGWEEGLAAGDLGWVGGRRVWLQGTEGGWVGGGSGCRGLRVGGWEEGLAAGD